MEKFQNKCYTQETRQWGIPSINIEISSHKLGSEKVNTTKAASYGHVKESKCGLNSSGPGLGLVTYSCEYCSNLQTV